MHKVGISDTDTRNSRRSVLSAVKLKGKFAFSRSLHELATGEWKEPLTFDI